MANNETFTLDKKSDSERIAKRIARAGICSRREAEVRINEGRVKVNGKTITSPALNVSDSDRISIDGQALPQREPAKLWRYYKPRGLVVSDRDEKDRETIFDHLPDSMPRVMTVGRLDIDSEGLLLLTNDGDLARHLELPATGWSRKYRVRVQGHVNEATLTPLEKGITIDGVRYGRIVAKLDRQMQSNAWLTVAIREGKNREVRRIMEHLGHKVSRLIRVSYGPFQLGDLNDGGVEQVKARVLSDQLGLTEPAEDGHATAKPRLRAKPGMKRTGAGRHHAKSQTSQQDNKRGKDAHNRGASSRHKTGRSGRR